MVWGCAAPAAGDNRPVSATDRPMPPLNADERTTLESWLDFHRTTLAMKCAGLDDDQAAVASVPPSGLTLTGIVQHMAEVERNWFRRVINGEDIPLVWSDQGDFQRAYDRMTKERAAVADLDPGGRTRTRTQDGAYR